MLTNLIKINKIYLYLINKPNITKIKQLMID